MNNQQQQQQKFLSVQGYDENKTTTSADEESFDDHASYQEFDQFSSASASNDSLNGPLNLPDHITIVAANSVPSLGKNIRYHHKSQSANQEDSVDNHNHNVATLMQQPQPHSADPNAEQNPNQNQNPNPNLISNSKSNPSPNLNSNSKSGHQSQNQNQKQSSSSTNNSNNSSRRRAKSSKPKPHSKSLKKRKPSSKRAKDAYSALTKAERREFRNCFRLFDKDGEGYITVNALRDVFVALNYHFTTEQLLKMVEAIDDNDDGLIDINEFVLVMKGAGADVAVDNNSNSNSGIPNQPTYLDEIKEAFEVFDKDGDGDISIQELQHIMDSLGEKFSVRDIVDMMFEADTDGNGSIDFDEFLNLMQMDHVMFKYNNTNVNESHLLGVNVNVNGSNNNSRNSSRNNSRNNSQSSTPRQKY